ncbi:ABC transporter permease [Fundidesulfovibrio butyratiphilus]
MVRFSTSRFTAMVFKEFVQMRRDRLTFAMMIGIPIMQLLLFGFAINANPQRLPLAVLCNDESEFSRTVTTAMQNSLYYTLDHTITTEVEGRRLLERGEVQFVLNIPQDFGRLLARGDRPTVLVEADATDPSATGFAISALDTIFTDSLNRDLVGPLAKLKAQPGPVDLRVHRLYNPEIETKNNIVPGLMGVVLTMTMVIITSLAITRERERGTMENLLCTPVRPFEVLTGKIVPYVLVGYLQMGLIILAANVVFGVPMLGSMSLLLVLSFFFISANLAVGILFSTIAQNQLQAMQMAFFFFLPSILLSGFMFPFRGMPEWAQWIGSILPLTHYLRVVRGIALKGLGLYDVAPEMWPMLAFLVVMMAVAVKRYRMTLD